MIFTFHLLTVGESCFFIHSARCNDGTTYFEACYVLTRKLINSCVSEQPLNFLVVLAGIFDFTK